MKKTILSAACACFVASCGTQPEMTKPVAPVARVLVSGIDLQYVDNSVRPQDDFYQHVNGKWLAYRRHPAGQGQLRSLGPAGR